MAMYLFASRLSSAVCARRRSNPATSTKRMAVAIQCSDCSRLATPAPQSPLPSTSTPAPPVECTVVLEYTDDTRESTEPPERDPEPLLRHCVNRASVGPCDRSQRDAKVPSTAKHRVRFANTFPRVNRKKKLLDSHEEGEVRQEDVEKNSTSARREKELVFRDSNLVSGSLEALIQRLVPTTFYHPDRAFLFAFLLSSRLFIKPNQLLGQVTFLSASNNNEESTNQDGGTTPRLVQLLTEWMETFPYDFRDDRIMAHVRSIIQKCTDTSTTEEVSTILQSLLNRLTALERYEEFLQRVPMDTFVVNGKIKTELTDLCSTPELLAQQLTIIELERLSYIGPEEFIQAFTRDSPREARNLEAYVAWSHRLTYLVATEIVRQPKKAKRVRTLELWLQTAQLCLNLGNFNSLMSILAGLNLSTVSRLQRTWTKVDRQQFNSLEIQMNTSGDFSNYRSTLKAATKKFSSSSDTQTRVIIPFFSLFLKDVYNLQEACSRKLPNGHINFERFWQMAKLVTEFITWQQVSCVHVKQPTLCMYLQASQLYNETELLRASYICEPPVTMVEQEQWKNIKSQESAEQNK